MSFISYFLRFARCQCGAAAVEAAFVLPIFLVLCLGTAEFGRLYWVRSSLQYAADETGRYAMAHSASTASDLQKKASNSFDGVSSGSLSVVVCGDTSSGDNFVTITLTSNFNSLTGLVPISGLTLKGQSRVPLLNRSAPLSPACP